MKPGRFKNVISQRRNTRHHGGRQLVKEPGFTYVMEIAQPLRQLYWRESKRCALESSRYDQYFGASTYALQRLVH